eukprot:s1467_g3.t1
MAVSKMSMPELKERLASHGETIPKQWSRAQVLLRLVELEGEEILQAPLKTKSPLRCWEIRVNQASRRKSEVTKLAEEMGLMLTGNETIEIIRLKVLEKAAMITEGHPQDPVGFGQWSHLSYQEVALKEPGYCHWVMRTAAEGDACYRLKRLSAWLETQKIPEQGAKTTVVANKKSGYSGKNKEVINSAETEEVKGVLSGLVAAVKSLAADVEKVKEDSKESKRRTHYAEDVTSMSSSSEWEKTSMA